MNDFYARKINYYKLKLDKSIKRPDLLNVIKNVKKSDVYNLGNTSGLFEFSLSQIIDKTSAHITRLWSNDIEEYVEDEYDAISISKRYFFMRYDILYDRIINDYAKDGDDESIKYKIDLIPQLMVLDSYVSPETVVYISKEEFGPMIHVTKHKDYAYMFKYENLGTRSARNEFYENKIQEIDKLISNLKNGIKNEELKNCPKKYHNINLTKRNISYIDLFHALIDRSDDLLHIRYVDLDILYERAIKNYSCDDDIRSYKLKKDFLIYVQNYIDFIDETWYVMAIPLSRVDESLISDLGLNCNKKFRPRKYMFFLKDMRLKRAAPSNNIFLKKGDKYDERRELSNFCIY